MSVESEILRIQHNIANTYAEAERQADVLYVVEGSVSDAPALDGMVPPGAIMPFLGLHAPLGYLICDGAEYQISKYQNLAQYLEEQFGTANHFGGDGETTFAVPDMRNLFLRGYHGEAEEQLSGDVGERQEATKHIYFHQVGDNQLQYSVNQVDHMEDDEIYGETVRAYASVAGRDSYTSSVYYTSRPVNMAVLYCIKT